MKDPKTILIVDDEVDLAELLKSLLESSGFRTFTAFNGEEGLKKVKEINPDLLILDINMPKIGGIEFYDRLCNKQGRTKIPVVVLTGRGELKEIFENINADGFLTKPFEMDELLREIEKALSKENDPLVFLIDVAESPQIRQIQKALNEERYNVVIVKDMDDFKQKAGLKMPDFVLMEYMQKEIRGEDLIRELRALPYLARVPLIVYSYSGFDGLEEKALKAGATRYLGKPKDLSVLISTLEGFQIPTRN